MADLLAGNLMVLTVVAFNVVADGLRDSLDVRLQHRCALRFGDPRAMAVAGALALMVHAVAGFTNKRLRSLVAGLLGVDHASCQMTYDLRRLRLHGLIARLPGAHTCVTSLTGSGSPPSTPRSPPGCSARCSRPTGRPRRSRFAARSPGSTPRSATTSPTPRIAAAA